LIEGLQLFWIFSEMERRVEAVADVAGARKLVQRLQIHELGRALALAAASRESLVQFTWNGFLHGHS